MLTFEQAKKIVSERLANSNFSGDDSLIILDQFTIEKPYAWIFCYTSRLYHETKETQYAIAGNSPIIVDKQTGKQIQYGSAYSLEEIIELYEEEKKIWNLVLIENNVFDNTKLLLLKTKFGLSNDELIHLKKDNILPFDKGSELRLTLLKKRTIRNRN
ncbi:YrhB domain-containing protein [Flavobacterium panici]|uniref:Immunity protein 35 domain-containing protein n=1 Tax=Flavobacterium panici TaxID=2654843 RepID=A0A9N8IZA1_9FLAO|nr:YrhB domain-containing protein [Flavobacterium panici]CAC9972522.1 hypothetical protein FLAPXU55_00198 [Flavobacterium panici]